jgi:hypothetical protein
MHSFAVAQHRDAIADCAQLFETMGDVDHAHFAQAQLLHDTKYFLGFGFGQRRSRLVENQQAGALFDSAANLDHLLPGGT